MFGRVLKCLLATSVLALLLAAVAQAASPSLNGEMLDGTGGTNDRPPGGSGTCDPGTGVGTISFSGVTGPAAGPYPGTFTESGQLHFDGNDNFTLSADVTITSGSDTVTVHKTGSGTPGFCNGGGFTAGPATVNYTATLPDGSSDSGTSTFHGSGAGDPFIGGGGSGTNFNGPLAEAFTSTPHPTSTSVSCTPGTVAVGQSTTCTATVTDTASSGQTQPTGTVTFASGGGGTFGSGGTCTLSGATGNSATCSVTYTPSAVGTGSHTITATYGGDSTHSGSSGNTTVTVTKRSTSTSVSCTPNPDLVGRPTTCKATVSDTSPGTKTTPTGTVSFTSNSAGVFVPATGFIPPRSVCTLSPTTTTGVASCSVKYVPLIARPHLITASYGGDATHGSSSGSTTLTAHSGSGGDHHHDDDD